MKTLIVGTIVFHLARRQRGRGFQPKWPDFGLSRIIPADDKTTYFSWVNHMILWFFFQACVLE